MYATIDTAIAGAPEAFGVKKQDLTCFRLGKRVVLLNRVEDEAWLLQGGPGEHRWSLMHRIGI